MTYHQIVRQFIRSLRNLDAILGKAIAHAEERKFDVNNFFSARLFPDMLPFAAQIRIACDAAKTAAAGWRQEAPSTRNEPPSPSRREIGKCVAYLEPCREDFAQTKPDVGIQIPASAGRPSPADEFARGASCPTSLPRGPPTLLRQGGVRGRPTTSARPSARPP